MPLWVYECGGCGAKVAALANSYVAHCCPGKNGKATIYTAKEESPQRILVGDPTRRDDDGVGGGAGAEEESSGDSTS